MHASRGVGLDCETKHMMISTSWWQFLDNSVHTSRLTSAHVTAGCIMNHNVREVDWSNWINTLVKEYQSLCLCKQVSGSCHMPGKETSSAIWYFTTNAVHDGRQVIEFGNVKHLDNASWIINAIRYRLDTAWTSVNRNIWKSGDTLCLLRQQHRRPDNYSTRLLGLWPQKPALPY